MSPASSSIPDSPPSSKRQKLSPHERTDRLSDLPDSILCHILSLIPTTDAVATSVLTKRWKHLWTQLPSLDFDDSHYSTKLRLGLASMTFVQFVNTVLKFHDASTRIQRFRLSCSPCTRVESLALNAWVCAAMQRKVEELDLNICTGLSLRRLVKLPRSVFTCGTLVALKLSGDIVVNVPSSVHLPNLKTLHLVRVWFSSRDALRNLLANCPVLENLCVDLHPGKCERDFSIYSPTLKHLTISRTGCLDKLEIAAPALEHLNIDGLHLGAFQ